MYMVSTKTQEAWYRILKDWGVEKVEFHIYKKNFCLFFLKTEKTKVLKTQQAYSKDKKNIYLNKYPTYFCKFGCRTFNIFHNIQKLTIKRSRRSPKLVPTK